MTLPEIDHNNTAQGFREGAIGFVAGSVGAVALVYVGQPLDTVKVRMQLEPQAYRGMVDCVLSVKRQAAKSVPHYPYRAFVRALYVGTTPALVANVAENSVLFATYGACQSIVAHTLGLPGIDHLSPMANAVAGSFASFFSSFTLCPTELIKVRLQAADTSNGNGMKGQISAVRVIQEIFKTDGFKGYYRGFGSTVAREMPGYFVFFGAYEGTRKLLLPSSTEGVPNQQCSPLATMAAGAAAGAALWTTIYPVDAIKSRIQACSSDNKIAKTTTGSRNNSVKTPFFGTVLKVIRQEGIGALYSGLKPTIVRTIPASAVMFLAIEYTKSFLNSLF
ncbi:mitochondrial ornithine transporter 1-like [Daktulosphaira vitifoliae]|uniref:mitochondrial ornithine transporter 1-like n=1 Tax=Daktulosphaira vitifoliae TaxID=58002 RepID=UPI0021AA3F58|nr:mitochondrial ornithine transporter 1-like [Daktulosphaira vitifoliae]